MELTSLVKGKDAYVELRIERTERNRLVWRGREVEDISTSKIEGGNVRALYKGGWGFISFNSLENLEDKVETAISISKRVGGDEGLYPVEPKVDKVKPRVRKDPFSVPLEKKKEILETYNDIILSSPKIETSVISYEEIKKRVIFLNSEGSFIEQEAIYVNFRATAIARDGSRVEQCFISRGSLGDFSVVEGLEEEIKGIAERARLLLKAPYIEGGEYDVILDPVLAGVFVHEAFGHLSEADFLYENPSLLEVMKLGRKFGEKHLNIIDDGTRYELKGGYKYDDEGVPSSRTYLIKEGVLVGRLHSRETAFKMKEKPTGNARAIDYRFPPIVRMSNTFIEPGEASPEDLFLDIKDGLYLKNWYGGMTSMEMFTFSAGEAYRIRGGRVEEMLKPANITGNVFETLKKIDGIANDLTMSEGGGCGKGEQSPLPVSDGSPHIRIRGCLVGGRK